MHPGQVKSSRSPLKKRPSGKLGGSQISTCAASNGTTCLCKRTTAPLAISGYTGGAATKGGENNSEIKCGGNGQPANGETKSLTNGPLTGRTTLNCVDPPWLELAKVACNANLVTNSLCDLREQFSGRGVRPNPLLSLRRNVQLISHTKPK